MAATAYGSEIAHVGRNISPWELGACERLTQHVRSISAAHPSIAPSHDMSASSQTLDQALRDAARTIRFNAKWFAEAPLATLLETSLTAAAASSASVNLSAAVNLIEVIGTYSLIPPQSLLQVVHFLTQTYYNATRANKTRKLADAVWTTLQHILGSHLQQQCVVRLLEVIDCRDDAHLESKAGHAQVAGALMIVSEKMLVEYDHATLEPVLPQLIDSLWAPAVNGTDILRELIMEVITLVLAHEQAFMDLERQANLDMLLEAVEPCVALTPDCKTANTVVDGLVLRMQWFELRHYPTIAQLCVDVNKPLNPQLSDSLLTHRFPLQPAREWTRGFEVLLKKLSASTLYIMELQELTKRTVEITSMHAERPNVTQLAKNLQECIENPQASKQAAALQAQAVIKIFKQCAASDSTPSEKNTLFEVICSAAGKCIDAAKFLFEIRADVEGHIYLESQTPAQISSLADMPTSRSVLYDISRVPLEEWDVAILRAVQNFDDWEVYDCFLTELVPLLSNHTMFENRVDFVKRLREIISTQLDTGIYPDPPESTGLTKSYVAVRLLRILIAILSYRRYLSKQDLVSLASLFLTIAGSRDYIVSIPCVHALTICCYELPDLMSSYMDDVIDRMSKIVTQRNLAIHVLVFLAGLSRSPELFRNFQTHDYKKIFGVCVSYLQSIRGSSALLERQQTPSSDQSNRQTTDSVDALPQYVYALAHHVIAFWYLALKADNRAGLKDYITSCLRYTNTEGKEIIEDQGLVTIDLMDCVDAEEDRLEEDREFDSTDGRIIVQHRMAGLLLITTETALRTAKTVVTIRRPTGTMKRLVQLSGSGRRDGAGNAAITMETSEHDYIDILPDDKDGLTYGRIYIPRPSSALGSQTVLRLNEGDDAVVRAMQSIDRTSALDSHKAGVIYIGENQTTEEEILQNAQGSPDYVEFIEGLGSLMRLKGAKFNAQGLDRMDDMDGEHVVVWANKLTELVFHITTLMPNNEDVNLNTANKKRHIGNDYVNIVFNNSGRTFDFNTFPSQFNSVYIVITPSARTSFLQTRLPAKPSPNIASTNPAVGSSAIASGRETRFYKVKVLTRPGYPSISSAAEEKIISGASLPSYVRNWR